jgi:allophanate hydrolase subunit 1
LWVRERGAWDVEKSRAVATNSSGHECAREVNAHNGSEIEESNNTYNSFLIFFDISKLLLERLFSSMITTLKEHPVLSNLTNTVAQGVPKQ